MRGFTTTLVVLTAALALSGSARALRPVPGEKDALQAVRRAHLTASTAAAARAEIGRAARLVRILPAGRRTHVAEGLAQFAAFDGRLNEPRALVLTGQLKANDDYFAGHVAPAGKTDVRDANGIVYRYLGHCFEFHPLASFGALNAHVARNDAAGSELLADALIARAVPTRRGGAGWEYEFRFDGGRPGWMSGMAQAVAAQAFARAAKLVPADAAAYEAEAHAAYAAIPGRLLTPVAGGPWIRLYSFSRMAVLNAQLQTVLSLRSYAADAGDSDAGALAARLEATTAATLFRFDTGYWTYYSLGGVPSSLHYQDVVVRLLRLLAPDDARFAAGAVRFASYAHQPPAFKTGTAGLGRIRFWLSKPARVTVSTPAGPTRLLYLYGGWHTLAWPEPRRPGVYPVRVSAVDWAGNRASFRPLPFVRATGAAKASRRSPAATGGELQPAFSAAVAIDDPAQAQTAASLGVRTVQMTVSWPQDATEPDAATVAALQSLPAGTALDLELSATLPSGDGGAPDELAHYAAELVRQAPATRELIVSETDAPTFTAVRSAVQEAVPGLPVGVLLDDAAPPSALAGTTPDLVAVGATADLAEVSSVLGQMLHSVPPLVVEAIPASVAASSLESLACDPRVGGGVIDGPAGLAASVGPAVRDAERGIVVCPGRVAEATPTGLVFPPALSAGAPPSVTFGCERDCLYLVTLDDANGRPVTARRGSLQGGASPAVVTLPAVKLAAGTYRLDVRLLSAVNPGPIARRRSAPLTLSNVG